MRYNAAMRSYAVWLALILVVYLALAGLFAVLTPDWQAPDEPAHYNYIHQLTASGQFPVMEMGDYNQAYLERLTSERFPDTLPIGPLTYEDHQPPLYYLLGATVFRATRGDLTALRLLSVMLGALFVLFTAGLVRLIWPQRPELALGAAAFTAFLPMHLAMAASVNNDALAELLLAALLFFSIRYVRLAWLGPHPPHPRHHALLIGVLLGLALITKVSAYVAAPAALAAPLVAWAAQPRRQRTGQGFPWAAYGWMLAPALLLALPWYARNAVVYGNLDILARGEHDAVVVGQLRTVELAAQAGWGAVLQRFVVWTHDSFWGVFGWMGAWMDARVYTALLALTVALTIGAVSRPPAPAAGRMAVRAGLWVDGPAESRFRRWALLALVSAALGTWLIYLAYNALFVQTQARYLFPALPIISLAAAWGWQQVVQRRIVARRAALGLLLAALLAVGWGMGTQGQINRWSLLILVSAAVALGGWSILPERARRVAGGWLFALPFAALALVALYALFAVVIPQLQ